MPSTLMLSQIGDHHLTIPDLVLGRSFSECQEGGSLRTLSRDTDVPFSDLHIGLVLYVLP